jgi:uncharacterized damage-inducible protein DinB
MNAEDKALRAQLASLLDWEDAHVSLDSAVEKLPVKLRGVQPPGMPHSVWQLVEHLRRTQFDILDFCRNPDYEAPPFDSHWPETATPPSGRAWTACLAAIQRDRATLAAMAVDPGVDLFAKIPHGDGQTYLRELVLVADHTAYHVGQIVVVRRLLDAWSSEGRWPS